MSTSNKQDIVLARADQYAHAAYKLLKYLPKEELFGLTSQLRRASLSVPLNIVEGYARQSTKAQIQFLNISYGSLKESQYLIRFAVKENMIEEDQVLNVLQLGEESAKLIWSKTQTLKKSL